MVATTTASAVVVGSSDPGYQKEKADLILMKNGDHWTCEIKRLDPGMLYARLDYINGGLIYSKGNNATQYNIGSLVNYRRARWSAQADFSSNLSGSDYGTSSGITYTFN